MKILVLGGTGVLSRAVSVVGRRFGHDVTILTDGKGRLSVPDGMANHIIADREDKSDLSSALSRDGEYWDLVIDCVCYTDRHASAIVDLLKGRVGHLITISTAIVYDESQPLPFNEETSLVEFDSIGVYEKNKILMERELLRRSSEINITILRPPTILGQGSELGIIPLHNRDVYLIPYIRAGFPVYLANGGFQKVNVAYNYDIARVIFRLGMREKAFGKIFNVANPAAIEARDHFQLVADILGEHLSVENVPSSIVQRANWGWSRTIPERIYDVSALSNLIGEFNWTDHRRIVYETGMYLLKHSPYVDAMPSGYLRELNSIQLCDTEDKRVAVLRRARRNVVCTKVDIRMNFDSPDVD